MRELTEEEIDLIYENLNLDEGTLETACERAGIDIDEISEWDLRESLRRTYGVSQCDSCCCWSFSSYRCDNCGGRMDDGEWEDFPSMSEEDRRYE